MIVLNPAAKTTLKVTMDNPMSVLDSFLYQNTKERAIEAGFSAEERADLLLAIIHLYYEPIHVNWDADLAGAFSWLGSKRGFKFWKTLEGKLNDH